MTSVIGKWRIDPSDPKSLNTYGHVEMIFSTDGNLLYSIKEGDKVQHMFLTYELSGNVLLTDQPSQPNREESTIVVMDDGTLVLEYEGEVSRYIRVPNE